MLHEVPAVEEPQVVLGRLAWKGNPPTKKNRPMVLNLALNSDGKFRRLGNFVADLRTTALEERERFFRSLDLLRAAVEQNDALAALKDIDQALALRSGTTRLLADLDSALGEGGLKTHVIPSEDYRKVAGKLVPKLEEAWAAKHDGPVGGPDDPLHVVARFYLGPRQRPDLLSLKEAASDILQEAGVILDDKWIESWDGSRRYKHDRGNPRTEVTIRRYLDERSTNQPCLF